MLLNTRDYSHLSIAELVRLCASADDSGAWQEFVRRFHRLIASVVLRTAMKVGKPTPQLIDDLIQETYLRLCSENLRHFREFDERHPDAFLGFVKVVAANIVRDHFKSISAQKRGPKEMSAADHLVLCTLQEGAPGTRAAIERDALVSEIEYHLNECVDGPDRDLKKRIFWLYFRVGLTASAIANLPGIGLTTKGVESTIFRITRALRNKISIQRPKSGTRSSKGVSPSDSF